MRMSLLKGLVVLLVISPLSVFAQDQIKGCIKANGVLRVISNDASCPNNQTEILMNIADKTGPRGPRGPKGEIGATGAAGPQGTAGPQGLAGSQGAPGFPGANGGIGPQGISGATGEQGAIGPQGLAGSQGAQGAKGDAGQQGIQGATGATGETGPAGSAGSGSPEYVYLGNTTATFSYIDYDSSRNTVSACQAEFGAGARQATSVEVAMGSVPNIGEGALIRPVWIGAVSNDPNNQRYNSVEATFGLIGGTGFRGFIMVGNRGFVPTGEWVSAAGLISYACSAPRA